MGSGVGKAIKDKTSNGRAAKDKAKEDQRKKDEVKKEEKAGKKRSPPVKPELPPKTTATATSANAAGASYLAIFNTTAECKNDRESIQKKCEPDKKSVEDQKKADPKFAKTGAMGRLSEVTKGLDELGRGTSNYKFKPGNAWMDKHCDGMWNKPQNLKEASEKFKTAAEGALKNLEAAQRGLIKDALQELGTVALEKAGAAAGKKIAGLIARSVAKNVVGGAAMVVTLGTVGTVLEGAMLAGSMPF
ncbi:hypothetical protein [Massilia genomosp. 1]|uniref:Uncharacterized protein n=1 Tax=Massilia genomosp. 1 TaxID=2609280 RepID=A0ABX0N2Z1_9BURK|nr:hypothetical protein [Massilia genomosp. 1]NHZ67003.1 hypothetical protein [Massilia genomosp. 1]